MKKCSLFNVQLSSVIFGGAYGAASFTKHCAKRHHFLDGCALPRLRFADRAYSADPLLASPRFDLFSNDIDQVSHGDVEVHQVQAPVRREIASNVAGAGA